MSSKYGNYDLQKQEFYEVQHWVDDYLRIPKEMRIMIALFFIIFYFNFDIKATEKINVFII
jgi:hypothetical protein